MERCAVGKRHLYWQTRVRSSATKTDMRNHNKSSNKSSNTNINKAKRECLSAQSPPESPSYVKYFGAKSVKARKQAEPKAATTTTTKITMWNKQNRYNGAHENNFHKVGDNQKQLQQQKAQRYPCALWPHGNGIGRGAFSVFCWTLNQLCQQAAWRGARGVEGERKWVNMCEM